MNDASWLKADIPAYVDICPLLGVKRTIYERVEYFRLYVRLAFESGRLTRAPA